MNVAIVDTGPLYASIDRSDRNHLSCIEVLADRSFTLIVPALVIAECAYLVSSRMGAEAEATLLRGLAGIEVEGPTADDLLRMAALVRQYQDFPLGATDASVVALAERMNTELVITLDRRHFGVVKPSHCESFVLLPTL